MPRLVILPGMDGTGVLLERFVGELSRRFDVEVISYPPDAALGYDALVQLVRAALPTTGPFVLIAESFSGPIAIRLAAERPPMLVALVLVATFATAPIPFASYFKPMLRFIDFARLCATPLAKIVLGSDATRDQQLALSSALKAVGNAVLRARARAALGVDARDAAARVEVPVLRLVARNDLVVSRTVSAALAAALRGSKEHRVHGPHFLLELQPTAAADAVAQFVSSSARTPA